MNVKAYYDNGQYELFDENGMLVKGGFESERQIEVFCEQNGYVLTEIFKIVLTNTL